MLHPVIVGKGPRSVISNVEIIDGEKHRGAPVFTVPANGVLRNVRIQCRDDGPIVTELFCYHKSF